jgi:Flp pilus assembly pilin Flp
MERSMLTVLAKLFRNNDGTTATEYGVIGALMAIAAVTAGIAIMPVMVP